MAVVHRDLQIEDCTPAPASTITEAEAKEIRRLIADLSLTSTRTPLPDPQPEPAVDTRPQRGFYANCVVLREMGHALPPEWTGHVWVEITGDGQYRYAQAADCEVDS